MKVQNMFCGAPLAIFAIALLSVAPAVKAACGDPDKPSAIALVLPFVQQSSSENSDAEGSSSTQSAEPNQKNSIIGLWHVTFVKSDGGIFYESFDTWHSDRTEFETANVSPLGGNVCVGVWKETRAGTIQLHHVGWTFADGNLIGSFTLDETNTVALGGRTYKGPFLYQFYDLTGNLAQQIKGTLTATRIRVDSGDQE